MQFIRQYGQRNCGQIAVASLTEAPLEEVIKVVGHSHGTQTRELATALRHFGFACPDRCSQRKPTDFGLAQLHRTGYSGWHWIAIGEGKVWDGHQYDPMPLEIFLEQLPLYDGVHPHRITSYLPVSPGSSTQSSGF